MTDPVRPTSEDLLAAYERGYGSWRTLYKNALAAPNLSQLCFQVRNSLYQQPCFPPHPELKKIKFTNGSVLYATGASTWETSRGSCNMPSFEIEHSIAAAFQVPTRVSLSGLPISKRWFTNFKEDHISILILAWSYILSARWAEILSGKVTMEYTETKAEWEDEPNSGLDHVTVNLGDISDEAARWWSAVLAPGEGWRSRITYENETYRSPWSTELQDGLSMKLVAHGKSNMFSGAPVSVRSAIEYLSKYCALHDIADQSHAALCAALFLPLLHSRGHVSLPIPELHTNAHLLQGVADPTAYTQHSWVYESHQLDQLMTLSCNTSGLKSLLGSAFYEQGLACNIVSPWLQSTFEVIDAAQDNSLALAHTLCSRVPEVGFLWVGGIIVGLATEVLRDARIGVMHLDLHAAAWSGTTQSFIQESVVARCDSQNAINRSDECRLLYLSQTEGYSRLPISPWEPFGVTAVEDTDIPVRLHVDCKGHGLRYKTWKWNTVKEQAECLECRSTQYKGQPKPIRERHPSLVSTDAPNLKDEIASEGATGGIFRWLRQDGFPRSEQEIAQHPWVEIDDSDEDSDLQYPASAANSVALST